MNLPNQLTVARFFLTIIFVAVLSSEWRLSCTVGLALFVIASITDYADGYIARKYGLETDFGRLMDPLMDKILMAAAFICLAAKEAFPAWVAIIIISREFLITGLRLLAASKGAILSAESVGKHKTLWQMITVTFFLLLLCVRELSALGYAHVAPWWGSAWAFGKWVLVSISIVLTLYSGLSYMWRNRSMIQAR